MHSRQENTIRSIVRVAISNGVKVLAGVLVGFLLPRIMGVEDYGFYKICTLYAAYVGLFSTGMVDGVALRWGGCNLEQIDRGQFRCATRVFLGLELAVSLIAAAVGFSMHDPVPRTVLLYLSIFLLTNNITSYFQTLSQCIGRFRELSRCSMLQSAMNAALIGVLYMLWRSGSASVTATVYLVASTGVNLIFLIVYLSLYRGMIFGQAEPLKSELPLVRSLIVTGLPLMVANLCDLLMLSIDRQFVSVLFDTQVYAVYAFAYNIVTMVTMVISAFSTVLYPLLKRKDPARLHDVYNGLIAAIITVTTFCMLLYYPLSVFIPWFLPAYEDSLQILRVILPGLLFSSVTTIVLQNYCKTLGLNVRFCVLSLAMLVVSAGADWLAFRCFGTTVAISFASVIVLFLWMLAALWILRGKELHCSPRCLGSLVFSALVFLVCTSLEFPVWTAFVLNCVCAALIPTLHFKALKPLWQHASRS